MQEMKRSNQALHGGQATIKVCLGEKCCQKGAQEIFTNLKEGFKPDEAVILAGKECFGYCAEGPCIAINDNIVKNVRPFLAVEKARTELDDPSCKADGLGTKSIDDIDAVLDSATHL
ncbi:MAG TPA: NAD(P)H-dependent oxidoreductase subunit E [Patescibacteria group bacterium]|nr:NAD(P)H-dependent oxidoreductase subunit E [Patescibacteria group bacterium]